MKKLLASLGLALTLLSPATLSFAEEAMPAEPAVEAVEAVVTSTEEAAPAAAEAPAAEAAPEAAAPVPDKGDTTWMMVSTLLVILMIVPGVALFYGGLVRAKNMLSILTQTMAIFCLISVLWAVYGYSLAFGSAGSEGMNWAIGGFGKLFLAGVTPDSTAATFTDGVVIPELIFIAFQLTFAAITVALIIGGLAERVKFSALMVFSVLWFTFSYLPIAHMVWGEGGYLLGLGALDFAGGTVVHINAGISALVGALVLGKRVGYGRDAMPPHNLPMTMIGASLLWVGWFGFNAGSNLEATGGAALAFINTILATAAAGLAWMVAEWLLRGKPSMLGVASGIVAGLVAVTPAAGSVGPMGSIILGAIAGVICLWGATGLKKMLGYDDSLDVFGIHGIGGIVGAIGTGVFTASSLGGIGMDNTIGQQVVIQATGVGITVVWSGLVSLIAYKLVDMTMGLRVSEEQEREGLDTASHGERAYSA